jgi:hypothetical protein
MAAYVPPTVGDELDGMVWTGEAWTPICPVDGVPMTEQNRSSELSCPVCKVSLIQRMRAGR